MIIVARVPLFSFFSLVCIVFELVKVQMFFFCMKKCAVHSHVSDIKLYIMYFMIKGKKVDNNLIEYNAINLLKYKSYNINTIIKIT